MIYPTYFVKCHDLFSFRYYGWGLILFRKGVRVSGVEEGTLFAVPIFPGWRFAWLAPWL